MHTGMMVDTIDAIDDAMAKRYIWGYMSIILTIIVRSNNDDDADEARTARSVRDWAALDRFKLPPVADVNCDI